MIKNRIRIEWFTALMFFTLSAACAGEPSIINKSDFIPDNGCYTGIFTGGESIVAVEKRMKVKFAINMVFSSFQTGNESLPLGFIEANWALGHLSSFTIEPQLWTLQEIIDGKHDNSFKRWAGDAAKFGKPIMIRPMHEMNGNWYAWSGVKNGGGETKGYGDPSKPDGPERYVDAFRHIHRIFDEAGAANIIWVWCPNDDVGQNEWNGPWNRIANYYPGDEYVDWLGMDVYNWGDGAGFIWRDFSSMYSGIYYDMEAINKDKPMLIGEFASEDDGSRKAGWMKDAFFQIRNNFKRIKAFVWFNIYKERKWPIDSSPESLKAFQEAMNDPYFKKGF